MYNALGKFVTTTLLLLPNFEAGAESLRCQGRLAQLGDTKFEVTEKCGEPSAIDHFCQPQASPTLIQAEQSGSQNTQINIAAPSCVNVDIWTYTPGKGRFITHLYFAQGQLVDIKYGDRIK